MLRKISFGLLRPESEQPRRPLFSRRGTEPPRPPSPMDFDDGPLPVEHRRASYAVSDLPLRVLHEPVQADRYLGGRLEALALEPLIAPGLRRINQMVLTTEQAMVERRGSTAPLSPGGIAFTHRALADPMGVNTPTAHFEVTPIPRRPQLQRASISERNRRQMPLRVQAIRRLHQEAMAKALAAHMEETAAESRRSSQEDENGNVSHLPAAEQAAWERRGVEMVQWDDFTALPNMTSPGGREPEMDVFAEAFSNAAFGNYSISPDNTPPGSLLEYTAPPTPEEAENPFEFDESFRYEGNNGRSHTPSPGAHRARGNFI